MSFKYSVKTAIILGFLYIQCLNTFAQDQRVADSLFQIYKQDRLNGIEKLELLRELSFNESNDINQSLKYAEELINLSEKEGNYLYLYRGYLQKGNSYRLKGDYNLAIDAFFKSAEAAIKDRYIAGEGLANMAIADTYSEIGNSKNAEIYYEKSIELLRKTNDSISLATALLNSGDEYFNTKKYNFALKNYKESGLLFKNAEYSIGIAYNLGNIGMINAEQGDHLLAKKNISEAISILEKLEDYYAISEYLTYMSDIYVKQNDWTNAFNYAERSLELALKYNLKKQISDSNLKLSELHEQSGEKEKSLDYYKNHIAYRDSVTNIESIKEMADLRTDYEVAQKQIEVDLLNQQKRNQQIIVLATLVALILIALLAFVQFKRNRFIYRTNQIIEKEKIRSDKLLLNILPEETALELKEKGSVKAKKFESVSVLFTDFKGFTKYSENLSPEKLVESVDFYYSKFDEIMEKYGLEKIKTIGDSYMAAGGLPFPTKDHAYKTTLAVIEIAAFVKEAKNNNLDNQTRFDIRIGINSGPVVAGVVGTKKFAYDIWGDTVNIASRMESYSEPGKINISENTYELIKDDFDCEYRGKVKVKNRGYLNMYFVNNAIKSVN